MRNEAKQKSHVSWQVYTENKNNKNPQESGLLSIMASIHGK